MIEAYDVYPKVVYCGIDDTIFRSLKQKKRNQIFFVGNTTISIDGYDLVEKALRLIPENLRPKLRIVSWQRENKKRLTDKELVEIYNHSIVTLCLSRFETFGLVPLESMACGTPVIATKVSGHRETVVDNKTGFLVDFDPKEIAEKLMFLIKTPSKVTTMGKNARTHIENSFTWEIQIDILEKTLTEVGERTR
jgi:glycosyltransferase involved in cell wall biosynthesis